MLEHGHSRAKPGIQIHHSLDLHDMLGRILKPGPCSRTAIRARTKSGTVRRSPASAPTSPLLSRAKNPKAPLLSQREIQDSIPKPASSSRTETSSQDQIQLCTHEHSPYYRITIPEPSPYSRTATPEPGLESNCYFHTQRLLHDRHCQAEPMPQDCHSRTQPILEDCHS